MLEKNDFVIDMPSRQCLQSDLYNNQLSSTYPTSLQRKPNTNNHWCI